MAPGWHPLDAENGRTHNEPSKEEEGKIPHDDEPDLKKEDYWGPEGPSTLQVLQNAQDGLLLAAAQKQGPGWSRSSVLERNPDEQVPVEEPADGETVALKDHPRYMKYFKMLKMGLPLAAAQNKAQQDGVDPSVLERNPNEQVPVEEPADEETVALKDHPRY